MNPLPSPASSKIADLLSKPLSCHRFDTLIGDIHSPSPTTSVASTVDLTPTVVASTTVVASIPTATTTSDSVPTLHPNLDLAATLTLPIVLDTWASYSRTPFTSDFTLEVAQAPYGLFRSATASVNSSFQAPVDPYTLITGEDVSVDLSSTYTIIDSDSGPSFTKVYFDIRQFGTATLTFIYSKSTLDLLHIFVDPTQIDWLHWTPLPRLILPESYFHIFGLDYLQAFALLHLIPIWIYYLLHFAVNLED